jgi:CHAT domain-containing protein
MLVNIYPDEIRFFFALDKYPTYLSAVNCLLELNRVEDSFVKHSHALAVLNQRCVSGADLRREVPADLLEARAGLRASLKKMIRPPEASQRSIAKSENMYQEEHRLWDIERKIRSHIYPADSIHHLPHLDDHAALETLKSDEVLVSFLCNDQKVGAFCAYKGDTNYTVCPVTRSELETAVRELHFLMENAVYAPGGQWASDKIIRHYLRRFFEWLISPLDLPRRSGKLILVLDGLFAQIPFMALIGPDKGWLKERYAVRVIVNPRELRTDRRQTKFSTRQRSAVFTPGNAGLPLIETEGREIKNLFPRARLYAGHEANTGNLRDELDRAGGFVHIATHASRSSENPLFSRILMGDGPFFPFDLFGAGIKARLVSLSGCQTAAPGIYYGNSFSLAKAFYQGGADNVLASLWPISDKISLVFMTEFYRALKSGGDIAGAFEAAVEKTHMVNDNPAFWGPFVLLGT